MVIFGDGDVYILLLCERAVGVLEENSLSKSEVVFRNFVKFSMFSTRHFLFSIEFCYYE